MIDFFYSNLFQTIVMFIVGLIAFVIYFVQKRDELKTAAAIVKLEIDNMEEALKRLKLTLVTEEIYKTAPLYQTLEWFKVRNLFVGKIETEQFNAINEFYNMVIVCEDARNKMKEAVHLNRIYKIKAVQFFIEDILKGIVIKDDSDDYNSALNQAKKIIHKYSFLYNDAGVSSDFIMNSAVQHFEKSLGAMFFISNTPAYEQIKKLIK